MADGPVLRVVQNAAWEDNLAKENVSAWYHQPKKGLAILAPGAYSRPDAQAGPSSGDLIVARQAEWEGCLRAYEYHKMGHKGNTEDETFYKVIEHEFSHCCEPAVPYTGMGIVMGVMQTYDEAHARYSHPDTAFPAVIHAVSVGFKVNAFTRVLRWNTRPDEVKEAFDIWLSVWGPRYRTGVLQAGGA